MALLRHEMGANVTRVVTCALEEDIGTGYWKRILEEDIGRGYWKRSAEPE
jgi:hypothetical protein